MLFSSLPRKMSAAAYTIFRQAQNNFNRANEPPSYYVLFIITRGSIEDLKETVQAAIFASKAPISIVFVGKSPAYVLWPTSDELPKFWQNSLDVGRIQLSYFR